MFIIPLIFFITYLSAFIWSLYSAIVQMIRVNYLRTNGINGNEIMMTIGFMWISVVNSYFMHIFIIASVEQLVLKNYQDYLSVSTAHIYVTINLLFGGFASHTVSWFCLSQHARNILMAIRKGDTDGQQFEFAKIQETYILGIWAYEDGLDLVSDFLNLYQQVPNSRWHLKTIFSEFLTFQNILMDTRNEHRFDIIYIAAHCDGNKIILSDDNYIDAGQLSRFASRKKTKLVILGVCQGDVFEIALLNNGIEAVIYWLFPIEDEYSIKFAKNLFASLSEGSNLKVAIENAKEMIPAMIAEGNLRVRGSLQLKF